MSSVEGVNVDLGHDSIVGQPAIEFTLDVDELSVHGRAQTGIDHQILELRNQAHVTTLQLGAAIVPFIRIGQFAPGVPRDLQAKAAELT